MHHRALRIDIDLSAVQHNFVVARQLAGDQKLFAVVKADAYGHGAVQVAKALDAADGFAVVTVNEALQLRKASINQPVLVLQGATTKTDYEVFSSHNLWPVVHCEEQLEWFTHSSLSSQLQPWLKVDSGMGRLGFQPTRANEILQTRKDIDWYGALTHFACADDPASTRTDEQIACFTSVCIDQSFQQSLANSAAVISSKASQADWARPGIMLYGSNPVDPMQSEVLPLKSVMRVIAPVIAVKQYKSGDWIGYTASYECQRSMSVAYVAIGYGDGLPRRLDSSASVSLNGHRCPVIGRVSMDSIAIDLGKTAAKYGDEAVLWGPEHPIEILAAAANTISYELMTSIKGPRQYVESFECGSPGQTNPA